ncbi:Fibronectin type III domain-containing protein [Paenibacillus sp. UNCCL117]|uniref:FIMAH domain-containing protein n=1 Tax=unclassified Paenibacillus TaxID=185978 RepID=UPI000890137F|nr:MULTISPECIES: metallophosphoesterase [unclassified Paenibacillus]SDE20212.1 Fibronectin type III domain-containing protein [Paenibacillus sp. cl123]SFW61828.1 Fibronectin type III domain-containing protein [Paenibacillus sp. UNCCL117]
MKAQRKGKHRLPIWPLLLSLTVTVSGITLPFGTEARAQENAHAVPPVLITELVPDTTNVNNADGYEFIEVYNNTDRPMNFKDYRILYRYLESETVWAHVPDDVVIEPGKTLVLWIINTYNGEATVADFNANFNVNLIENKEIVRIYSGGMANTRMREVVVMTNTGHELVSAFYNEGEQITKPDKGIFYKYPQDGSKKMDLISGGLLPGTPGKIEPDQVPAVPIAIQDTEPPVLRDKTGLAAADPTEDLVITAEATDASLVKSLTLHYRMEGQAEFKTASLKKGQVADIYQYKLGLLELLGNSGVEYYFTATDGYNEAQTPISRINLVNPVSPRVNLTEGSMVKGDVLVKAAANQTDPSQLTLSIDGNAVSGTERAMEQQAFFVFEAQGMNGKNAITMGKDILFMADKAVNNFDTVIAPIDPERLEQGENVIALRAGSSVRPYFEDAPEKDLDDYDVRNVRLVLADGTVLRSKEYTDPALLIDVGDNGRFLPVVYFTFEIAPDKLNALSYRWQTNTLPDGPHTLKVTAPSQDDVLVGVNVDNTGPAISTNLEQGKLYKGSFTIEAAADDAVSGVKRMDVQLDGQNVTTPYSTSSAALAPGAHTLQINTEDHAGNRSEETITFLTPEENPNQPVLIAPEHGQREVDTNPTLKVSVSDPTHDTLNVTFRQGYEYDAAAQQLQLFKHATAWEPPSTARPSGETSLTEEERTAVKASDDLYVTVDSTEKFPYIRMELKLDEAVAEGDLVEVLWEGNSLPGRKVTMYAWNHGQGKWNPVDSFVPSSEQDFELKGTVRAGDYVRDQVIHMMIQDQIPSRGDYDYTVVWMSDTQFYSELHPHIYESMVKWIRDQAGAMNVKYVIHTGDLVNEPKAAYQWNVADDYMQLLEDADIPYGVLAGNHDVGTVEIDYTTYEQYFGAERFEDKPYYGESYKNNRGHYDLISSNGNDFIFLYMGWGVNEEDMAWMNQVLSEHPDRMAIVNLHDYLQPNGNRSATGNKVFEEVIVKNKNVVAVFSGHYTGSALRTDEIDDDGDSEPDRRVYQMLNDYQGHEEGGMGYMKLLHFDTESNTIFVNTYSPYKNDYNYYDPTEFPGKDETTLALELTPRQKRVSTDYVRMQVYTGKEIGKVSQVPSGQTAQVVWQGLDEEKRYSWYALVEDAYGGRAISDVWSFTTRNVIDRPSQLRADQVTDTSARLAWNRSNDVQALAYDLYRNGALLTTVTDSAYRVVTEVTYQVDGLTPDTQYEFYVVAKDERGATSEPSLPLIVKTQVNLSVVQGHLDRYITSGEVTGPLASQLSQRLRQAAHHYERGASQQAAKHLQDFLKHLANPPMQDRITAEARQVLEQKVTALHGIWSGK